MPLDLIDSRRISPFRGEIVNILYCSSDGCRYALVFENVEGCQWLVFYKGGGLTFWTRFLVCRSLAIEFWQATLGLRESNVEDVAICIGADGRKVITTELVGRERWVRVMERVVGTQDWKDSLVLKFVRRELKFLMQYDRDVEVIGGSDDEPRAGEISDFVDSEEE
jgi:hypothetical protein